MCVFARVNVCACVGVCVRVCVHAVQAVRNLRSSTTPYITSDDLTAT